MRCKVGDLVVVVRCRDFPQNEGRFGTILEKPNPEDFWHYGGEDWAVKPQGKFWGWADGQPVEDEEEITADDCDLCPIRDPGPDAVDETIQRLGTPMDMRLRELENELAKMNESLDRLEKVLTR